MCEDEKSMETCGGGGGNNPEPSSWLHQCAATAAITVFHGVSCCSSSASVEKLYFSPLNRLDLGLQLYCL